MTNPASPNQAMEELLTIRDYIRWAATQFSQADLMYGHGTTNAWDEAVNLVLSSIHLSNELDPNVLDAKLIKTEKARILEFIDKRIKNRTPVPYLVNEAWFAGNSFYVDERVIIPRSPIAELIEEDFSPWVDGQSIGRVLDLCTGSGCIAISMALAFPNAIVDAVDMSPEALSVAKLNVERYGLEEGVNLIQADLFEGLDNRYDLILSNPPYVGLQEYESLPKEYLHEPRMALLCEENGLSIVRRILAQAEQYLTPTGILIVEVGRTQTLLEKTFPQVPFTWLQFEEGGEGVFLLTADELRECRDSIGA